MSWEFINSREVKHTHREHECIACGRKIPVGKSAFTWWGKYDGQMQTSYACMFCMNNEVMPPNEELSGWAQEFTDWLYEQDFMECKKCGERYSLDWNWINDHTDVEIECEDCEEKWTSHIGWGEDEVKK